MTIFLESVSFEESGEHESYRSAVFVRQTGEICADTFLVATLDKEIVGYTVGTCVQQDPREAWILRLGVREHQRRNGIGTILLNELIEFLFSKGVRGVRLTVSPWNLPAVGLYQKNGFEQERYCVAYFGKDEDRLVMRKVL
jgi:ribosomal protein S18 acetylase RimI-like enzyme